MRIGVSSYSFSRYMRENGASLFDVCRMTREFGFEAIDFTALKGDDRLALARELRSLCAEIGLNICAYAVGADLLNMGDAAVDALCREIDIAEALGAPLLRHDVCFSMPENMTWETAVDVIAPRARAATRYAENKGIVTCTENHGYIFQDSQRVRALIEAVGHKNYGWLVDMGNFMCADEKPSDAVRVAAPYARHVHAKDFYFYDSEKDAPAGAIPTRGGHCLVGTVVGRGVVGAADCLRILHESGYDGVVSLEFEGKENVPEAIVEGRNYLKKTIEKL